MAKPESFAGDSNRITREYFDSILIEMRHLDAQLPDTSFTLFGESFQTPIMTASLSHLNNLRDKGMSVMAAGAKGAGACMWSGMGSEAELEEITQTGAKTIKIIKPYADRVKVYRKIEHAKSLGVLAVGMDVDHQFAGNGGYDNVFGDEMHPVSTKELRDFVEAAKIPFIVKGVLSGIDACKCQESGVAGIVVSHHHGIMPYAAPPLRMLPEIRRVVGKDFPVFLDCGIESGADVYKALALGADAVCVGRALMEALKNDGAAGVTQKIKQLNDELKGFMARTAVHNLASMDAGVIVKI